MKLLLFILFCAGVVNAQLINQFDSEWRSTGKSYSYKTLNGDLADFNKSYRGVILNDNFSYRNNYYDLTGTLKWQAEGSVPVAIRENLNTYRFFIANRPSSLYNLMLSGGIERLETNSIGWVSDSLATELFDSLGNLSAIAYTPPRYQEFTQPDQNLLWLSGGYNFQYGDYTFIPSVSYFIKTTKGTQTINPMTETDSLRTIRVNSKDYDLETSLSSSWRFNDNNQAQVKIFYHDDLDQNDYCNVFMGEGGIGSDFLYQDFRINNYLGAGQLHYQNGDNFFFRSKVTANYNTHPDFNIKINNYLDIYQDQTFSEKVTIYSAWLLKTAGYDYDQISGYASFNSKGAFHFARLGLGGRYWQGSWLNELDFNLKTSKVLSLFSCSAKNSYCFNQLNSIFWGIEYTGYLRNSFKLDNNDIRINAGIQSGIF